MRIGEAASLVAPQETVAFVRAARRRIATSNRSPKNGFVFGPNKKGDQMMFAASVTMKPGLYRVNVSAVSDVGEERAASVNVILEPPQTVPLGTTTPPVVLLNGWQFACPALSNPADTFGASANNMNGYLTSAPVVYFFDNCVEGPNGTSIEDLGNTLGKFLNMIRYDDGTQVPQVDLVAHSMGGLIARAYLAGLQVNGSFSPPQTPLVRKLIEIATPNLGSFLANQLAPLLPGTQTTEMLPGSAFLLKLLTWNQGRDDLRGVDALAIVGDASAYNGLPNASDGVVSSLSASLQFARDPSRTRILPYCHTDFNSLETFVLAFIDPLTCPAKSSIANFDEAPITAQLVQSFLTDSSAWTTTGATPTTPTPDPYLSLYRAFFIQPASGSTLSSSTSVFSWSSVFGAQQYVLYIGSAPGGKDVYAVSEGTALSATVSGIPIDGRTLYARLYTNAGNNWSYVDSTFQAANITNAAVVTLTFTNNLIYPVNVLANGTPLGLIGASSFSTKTVSVSSASLSISFSMIRPTELAGLVSLGDSMDGVFNTIQNPSGTYNFVINNRIGNQTYFVPFVTNNTTTAALMDVNGGLASENKCFCTAPAFTNNVTFGYYKLFTNSNVRAYGANSLYFGSYIFWGYDASVAPAGNFTSSVQPGTGILPLTLTKSP